jgi:hypothetical protein
MPFNTFDFTFRILGAVAIFGNALLAQELEATIVGCAAVDCPIVENSTETDCQVVDYDFRAIGLSRIPFEEDSPLRGLSWVKGVNQESLVTDNNNNDMTTLFHQRFYLGTPGDLDIEGTRACAVFFNHVSDEVQFDDTSLDGQGTCAEALSEPCVAALSERARSIDYDGLSIQEACSRVQAEFSGNMDEECIRYAGTSNWADVEARGERSLDLRRR